MAPGTTRGRPRESAAGLLPLGRKAGGKASLACFARRYAVRAPEGTARLTIREVLATLGPRLTILTEIPTKLLPLQVVARQRTFPLPLRALRPVATCVLALLCALRPVATNFLAPLGAL